MVTIHSTADPMRIDPQVLDWLYARPVENNVLLSLVERHRRMPDPGSNYLWVTEGTRVSGVAVRVASRIAMLSALEPHQWAALVRHLHPIDGRLPGVNGPADTTAGFAAEWEAVSGAAATLARSQVLLRLDREVQLPPRPAGHPRPAHVDELPLLVGWAAAVVAAAGMDRVAAAGYTEQQLRSGHLTVWDDGGPVAMCGANPAVGGVLRVGPLFCPPEHRGHGYAAAVIAQVCDEAMRTGSGACVLYSESANTPAVELHRRIGFTLAEKITEYRFTAAPRTAGPPIEA